MRNVTISILFLCALLCRHHSFAQSDTVHQRNNLRSDSLNLVTTDSVKADDSLHSKKPKPPYEHQVKIAMDIARIPLNIIYSTRQSYEFQADYLLRKEVYINAEAGFGRGKVNYDFLKYNSNSFFLKVGVQQSRIARISDNDFDVFFLGANYGMAFGKRSEADYTVTSFFGTTNSGKISPQNFMIHWGEIVAGVRVEMFPRVFMGWNIRGKFLFNGNTFKEVTPNFIAGYGKADKSTIFDFNFYICYALRWGKNG